MGNLLRNGGFERGNIMFWERITYGSDFTVQTSQKKRGSYGAVITSDAEGICQIMSRDFIKVNTSDILEVGGYGLPSDDGDFTISCVYYNEHGDYITAETMTKAFTGLIWSGYNILFIVPEEAKYVRPAFKFSSVAALTNQYFDELTIQILSADNYVLQEILLASIVNETTKHTVYGDEFFTGIWKQAEYHLYCTSLTGTIPTLDVTIQGYDPNTAQWKDIMVFQQLDAAGGEFKTLLSGLGWKQRVKYVTAGTAVTDCDFIVGAVYKR